MRRIVIAIVASLTLAVFFGAAAFDCSDPKPAVDAQNDGMDSPNEKPTVDAMACTMPTASDEPPASFWLTPGWQRLEGPVACCAFAVASNPADQLPPLKWIPCTNSAPDCLEDEATWGGTYKFMSAVVSRDALGQPRLLKFKRGQLNSQQEYAYYEDDVYDFATRAPMAGWRQAVLAAKDVCVFSLNVGGPTLGVLARTKLSDPHDFIAWGGPPLTMPVFEPLSGTLEMVLTAKNPAIDQSHRMSSTSLAFGLVLGGSGLVRMPVGGAAYVRSTGNFPLSNISIELVEGDDVYAGSFYGSVGWSQEYFMASDGNVTLFRGKDKTHVSVLRSDGKTLFWVESYGLPDPHIAPGDFIPQPNMEVWSAPYTNSAATLAATAKKIATIANHARTGDAVAFGGVYAFTSDDQTLTIVRGQDGAVQQLAAGSGRRFNELTYVSESEVWAVLGNWEDDGGKALANGVALARYQLRDW